MTELLVTVATIGILMVLVTPTLRLARQEAQSQACLSNLRQINMAFTAWSSEHNFMPVVSWYSDDAESNNKTWAQIIAPYVGSTLERPDSKVYVCPAQPHVSASQKWPAPWGGFNQSVDYAQNLVGSGWPGGRPVRLTSSQVSLSKIVYLVEGRNVFYDASSWNNQVAPYQKVHPSGMHYLFMDGHVEVIKNPNFTDVQTANF